jgi:hypothetical protein
MSIHIWVSSTLITSLPTCIEMHAARGLGHTNARKQPSYNAIRCEVIVMLYRLMCRLQYLVWRVWKWLLSSLGQDTNCPTKRISPAVKVSYLNSRETWFESLLVIGYYDWVLSLFSLILCYFKIGHDRFLPDPSEFIIRDHTIHHLILYTFGSRYSVIK